MYETVLSLHNPKDKRSHNVLRFFSEDLYESDKIDFVKAIFEKGSWVLPAEISRTSRSFILKQETNNILTDILGQWVINRIEHSNTLSRETRNPHLPRKYSNEFKEAIIAIKYLDFPEELMMLIERFIKETYISYLHAFIDGAFWVIIDEFNIEEIEIFFSYFSNLYFTNPSNNLGNFLYEFLKTLATSPKIFFISERFVKILKELSQSMSEVNLLGNQSILISQLLIDLIITKKIDLSEAKYSQLILPVIEDLESGSIENLELLSFLKKFNYHFDNYDFKKELNSLFGSIETNLNKLNGINYSHKKAILHHFVRSSEEYWKFLIFNIGFLDEDSRIDYLINFIDLIDKLRESFNEIIWFNEYDNLELLKGELIEALPGGFKVSLNKYYDDFFNRVDKTEDSSQYLYGFLNLKVLRKMSDGNKFHSYLSGGNDRKDYLAPYVDSVSKLDSFFILTVNYSSSNKGSALNLAPINQNMSDFFNKLKIKMFFFCIDVFFINKSYDLMGETSPLYRWYGVIGRILYNADKLYQEIGVREDRFWELLKICRPILYNEIYVYYREKKIVFESLLKKFKESKIISGTVDSMTHGGLNVNLKGLRAFLPGSEIECRKVYDYDSYVGRKLDFKILQIYPDSKNIIVSHKAVIEKEFQQRCKVIKNNLKIDQVLEGTVKNVTPYGVFVDLGGIDGLIHITDLCWERVNHPKEIVSLGEHIKVKVLDFDEDKSKITLGYKQLKNCPWKSLENKVKEGKIVKGRVKLIRDFGAFIEIMPGVDGLIHRTEMSWNDRGRKVNDFVKLNDVVHAKVLTLNKETRKINLSIKRLKKDPWLEVSKNYCVGGLYSGIVVGTYRKNVLIKLEEGVQGFVPISRFTLKNDFALRSNKDLLGKEIEVLVLEIDDQNKRLKLRYENSRTRFLSSLNVQIGDILLGEIIDIHNGTGIIRANNIHVDFICPKRFMHGIDGTYLNVGYKIKFVVIEIDIKKTRVIVSHTKILENK